MIPNAFFLVFIRFALFGILRYSSPTHHRQIALRMKATIGKYSPNLSVLLNKFPLRHLAGESSQPGGLYPPRTEKLRLLWQRQ